MIEVTYLCWTNAERDQSRLRILCILDLYTEILKHHMVKENPVRWKDLITDDVIEPDKIRQAILDIEEWLSALQRYQKEPPSQDPVSNGRNLARLHIVKDMQHYFGLILEDLQGIQSNLKGASGERH